MHCVFSVPAGMASGPTVTLYESALPLPPVPPPSGSMVALLPLQPTSASTRSEGSRILMRTLYDAAAAATSHTSLNRIATMMAA